MSQIKKTFTWKEVKNLNSFQSNPLIHAFTCCGPGNIPECERNAGKSEGTLKATTEGWICPCGKYTQSWAHESMLNK